MVRIPSTITSFYEQLEKYIRDKAAYTLVLGGDFNVTLEELDITGRKGPRMEGRKQLQHLIQT